MPDVLSWRFEKICMFVTMVNISVCDNLWIFCYFQYFPHHYGSMRMFYVCVHNTMVFEIFLHISIITCVAFFISTRPSHISWYDHESTKLSCFFIIFLSTGTSYISINFNFWNKTRRHLCASSWYILWGRIGIFCYGSNGVNKINDVQKWVVYIKYRTIRHELW